MSSSSKPLFSEIFKNRQSNLSAPPVAGSVLGSKLPVYKIFESICAKLHPLFAIDCSVILIYDEQLTVIKEAFISKFNSHTEQLSADFILQPSELTALQKQIAGFSFPFIKTMEEWMDEANTNHCLLNGESHYKYHCYLPLEINNKIIGTLELHNSAIELSTECLTFCSNMADLIAFIIHTQYVNLQIDAQSELTTDNKIAHINYAKQQQAAIGPHTDNIIKEQIAQIDGAETLHKFIEQSGSLFPNAFNKIRREIEEVLEYKKQLDDTKPHEHKGNDELVNNYPFIIGAGPGMKKVFYLLDQVVKSESTVLILGETGTGKELIAQAIHENSARKHKPMIKINCAAIPANLIESELFGHERGSFTGATDKRIGKFELADKGTLFLDEIGELPLDMQVKLLRALQEKEIERVGGKTTIKTDVRIISATNRDLLEEVEKGHFRLDLYFRLNVFPVYLPALRERKDDIALLATHFLAKYVQKTGKPLTGFTRGAIKQMVNYNWPGNVREMEHLIERQVLLSQKPVISDMDIPANIKSISGEGTGPQKIKTINENERDHIFAVLQICKGRVSGPNGAAKLLGVPTTTLNSKIKRLGLNKRHS